MDDGQFVSSTLGTPPPSAAVTECLELLLWETPVEALQIIVHTLATWLTEQETSTPGKEILVAQFAHRVYEAIEAEALQRRVPPPGFVCLTFDFERRQAKANQILAHLHGLNHNKALDFLAKVTGLWIHSYPEELLRQDVGFQSEHEAWVQTDQDLAFVLEINSAPEAEEDWGGRQTNHATYIRIIARCKKDGPQRTQRSLSRKTNLGVLCDLSGSMLLFFAIVEPEAALHATSDDAHEL